MQIKKRNTLQTLLIITLTHCMSDWMTHGIRIGSSWNILNVMFYCSEPSKHTLSLSLSLLSLSLLKICINISFVSLYSYMCFLYAWNHLKIMMNFFYVFYLTRVWRPRASAACVMDLLWHWRGLGVIRWGLFFLFMESPIAILGLRIRTYVT